MKRLKFGYPRHHPDGKTYRNRPNIEADLKKDPSRFDGACGNEASPYVQRKKMVGLIEETMKQ